MGSYQKACKFCGQTIWMVEITPGQWRPENLDLTAHYCSNRNTQGNIVKPQSTPVTPPRNTPSYQSQTRYTPRPSLPPPIHSQHNQSSFSFGNIVGLVILLLIGAGCWRTFNNTSPSATSSQNDSAVVVPIRPSPTRTRVRPTVTSRTTAVRLTAVPATNSSERFACVVILVETLNVRAGPGTEYVQLFQVSRDEWLPRLHQKSGWYAVLIRDTDGNPFIGWVSGGTQYTRAEECVVPGTSSQQQDVLDEFYMVSACVRLTENCHYLVPEYFTPDEGDTALPIVPPPATANPPRNNCSSSYPTVCIPPAPPDLDCDQVPYDSFKVVGSDPHGFDLDFDGVGCEPYPN